MTLKKPELLAFSFIIVFVAAGIGSFFTFPAIDGWYALLNKPFFNPPNWIFGPVWTLLYTLMAVSLYLVWVKSASKKALNLFYLQLALNTVWSVLFFGFQQPLLALIEIVVLWVAIFLTIKAFSPISKMAAYLLIPYLLWVSFATLLNGAIVFLN